jgi:hypothetical protein
MEFDPQVAASRYAEMETDELVNIAFLDPNYLAEAKLLAKSELSRRGTTRIDDQFLNGVRSRIEEAKESRKQAEYDSLASMQRHTQKAREIFLIGALWVVAPLIPTFLSNDGHFEFDWMVAAMAAMWAIVSFFAVRNARSGRPRLLYLVVVIPASLLLLSIIFRVLID